MPKGNGAYLALAQPLRAGTKRLPAPLLDGVVRALDLPLAAYIGLCRRLPLPMADNMHEHQGKLDPFTCSELQLSGARTAIKAVFQDHLTLILRYPQIKD